MKDAANSMDIFKLLPRTNCRECQAATCLAFSVLVTKGQKKLEDCPHIGNDAIDTIGVKSDEFVNPEDEQEKFLEWLKNEIGGVDFPAAAERLGGEMNRDKLRIPILGKNFLIDKNGDLHTDAHVNPWVQVPLLNYVISGKGIDPVGQWVPFGALKDGAVRNPLYRQRCEKPIRQIADDHTELFLDILGLFGGKSLEGAVSADEAIVLHPFPKVPVLICYWLPEEDFESKLAVFYDITAVENLDIDSIFTLGTGMARMFRRIIVKHNHGVLVRTEIKAQLDRT